MKRISFTCMCRRRSMGGATLEWLGSDALFLLYQQGVHILCLYPYVITKYTKTSNDNNRGLIPSVKSWTKTSLCFWYRKIFRNCSIYFYRNGNVLKLKHSINGHDFPTDSTNRIWKILHRTFSTIRWRSSSFFYVFTVQNESKRSQTNKGERRRCNITNAERNLKGRSCALH